ncbi:hypothetical protein B0O99DRAFT_591073 [Bisporella sp. PMI_857]|nr:hypothetical protein B0O99DRAFT_591073 [Bisporella sp. PMI_857]
MPDKVFRSEVEVEAVMEEHPKEVPENDNVSKLDAFEKNSFREPKCWLQCCGLVDPPPWSAEDSNISTVEMGVGCLAFTGNYRRKLKGTISIEPIGWEGVSISGW